MGYHLRRSSSGAGGSLVQPIEEWPYLDQEVLQTSRTRKVCMTCHWFRHHAGVNGCSATIR
jgi:hypothetical protein